MERGNEGGSSARMSGALFLLPPRTLTAASVPNSRMRSLASATQLVFFQLLYAVTRL